MSETSDHDAAKRVITMARNARSRWREGAKSALRLRCQHQSSCFGSFTPFHSPSDCIAIEVFLLALVSTHPTATSCLSSSCVVFGNLDVTLVEVQRVRDTSFPQPMTMSTSWPLPSFRCMSAVLCTCAADTEHAAEIDTLDEPAEQIRSALCKIDWEFVPDSRAGSVLVAMSDVRHVHPLNVAVLMGTTDVDANTVCRTAPFGHPISDQKNVLGFASCALDVGEIESAGDTKADAAKLHTPSSRESPRTGMQESTRLRLLVCSPADGLQLLGIECTGLRT